MVVLGHLGLQLASCLWSAAGEWTTRLPLNLQDTLCFDSQSRIDHDQHSFAHVVFLTIAILGHSPSLLLLAIACSLQIVCDKLLSPALFVFQSGPLTL